MKKLLLLITGLSLSGTILAQLLDTVVVRNLVMRADELAWCIGKNGPSSDSATLSVYRRVEAVAKATTPLTWTTSLTVDSLNGRVVMDLYKVILKYGSEFETRYTQMKAAISSKANLSTWVTEANTQKEKRKDMTIGVGESLVMDQ